MSTTYGPYTIGMIGPANVSDLREFLPEAAQDSSLGLGGQPVNILTRELLRRGHRVVVITLDPAVEQEVVFEGDRLKVCIGPYRKSARARALDFFSAEREYLLRTILRERADVLHGQWTYEFALAASASGLPHVITAHDAPINVLRLQFVPYRLIRLAMAYTALRRANHVAVVSPYVRTHLWRYRFYRGHAEVIPNGLPPTLFSGSTRAAHPVGGVFTFATVSQGWGERKNGTVALEAFAEVRKVLPQARLVMFGSDHGSDEPAIHWAKARGLTEGVEFAGQVPYAELLARLASEVQVLVHPSLEESHGMALIEAMALGIPVIGGAKSGAVPWTLDEGRAGMLVDVTSPDVMSQAMLSLALDAEARDALGRAGRESVWRRFRIEVVADAYERLYARALGHSVDAVYA